MNTTDTVYAHPSISFAFFELHIVLAKCTQLNTELTKKIMPSFGQTAIPAVYFRGGTSKGIFLQEKDIPAAGKLRDKVLKRMMGAPDHIQIDGMGGSRVVTSKIAIISPSKRDDADVDYTFAQIGIGSDEIDYSGNCGNISCE